MFVNATLERDTGKFNELAANRIFVRVSRDAARANGGDIVVVVRHRNVELGKDIGIPTAALREGYCGRCFVASGRHFFGAFHLQYSGGQLDSGNNIWITHCVWLPKPDPKEFCLACL